MTVLLHFDSDCCNFKMFQNRIWLHLLVSIDGLAWMAVSVESFDQIHQSLNKCVDQNCWFYKNWNVFVIKLWLQTLLSHRMDGVLLKSMQNLTPNVHKKSESYQFPNHFYKLTWFKSSWLQRERKSCFNIDKQTL